MKSAAKAPAPTRNAVVLAVDARLFPAAVFAAQRLAILNDRDDTDIVVFTSAPADEIEKANALTPPVAVRTIALPKDVSDPVWLRFFAIDALAATHACAVYLDADTWVEDARLFGLFDLDMAGHVFGGVRDGVVAFVPGLAERERVLGPGNSKYLNTGVLLVDLKRFAAGRMMVKLMKIVRQRAGHLPHRDQSALNLLLGGDWLELSPAFNLLAVQWGSFVARVCPPAVVHFAGAAKPWTGPAFALDHPARTAMERWFPQSPWKDFLPGFVDLSAVLDPSKAMRRANFDAPFPGKDAFIRYLAETEFADVAAGLSDLRREHLPAS